jgi:Putative Actinobacterial Holin-X, holin superfamily III
VAHTTEERSAGRADRRTVSASGSELLQMLLDYAKQETLEPIKGLARFVGVGVGGSLALSVGLVLLLVALLRLLQTETGSTFTGHLSWLPYVITAGAALGVGALAGWRIAKGPAARTNRSGAPGTRR